MKILKSSLPVFFLLLLLLPGCEKDNGENPTPPQYDNNMILSRGSGAKLVLTNPPDGQDLYVCTPSPGVDDVKNLKAGYMSKKAIFVAKTALKAYTMSIYTCDAKTGNGTQAITGNDLYVQDINTSPAGPQIVFTGKPNGSPQYESLYTIGEDGSGLTPVSEPLELVEGPGGVFELQAVHSPAFSPDGSKIAFDVLVANFPAHDTFYEFIVVMNSDGSAKEVLYSEPGKNIGFSNLCWTHDSQFILFVRMAADDNFHRRVKVLNVNNQQISDITTAFEINGDQVNDICTSPNSDKIVFNQHLGGGSDLFVAGFEINDHVLTIKGSPVKLTNRDITGYSYYTPSWQWWDINQ